MVEQPSQIAATGTGILQDVLNSFCSIQPTYATVAYFFCSVSFVTMTAISVDRYLDLYLRERYRLVLAVKKVNIILALMWIGSIIWAISRTWDIRINKINAIVIGFFSIVVTLFWYFRIYWTLNVLKTRVHSHRTPRSPQWKILYMLRYRRSVTSMMYIFVLFVACSNPYFCSLLAVVFLDYDNASLVLATNLTSLVIFLNSCLKQFVHCWRIKEFRVRMKSIAQQIGSLCWGI